MKPVSCLIVDDERLARRTLRRLVEANRALTLAGEAANRSEALQLVEEHQPSLLFLDIQMPGGGGFEILEALDHPPAVVFVTAHDQHAIRAFEVNALDYLLKPVSAERFDRAVAHAVLRIRDASHAARPAPKLAASDVALLELGGSGHFVAVDHIIHIEADGNYTRVTTRDGRRRVVRQTIKEWASSLPPEMFVQLDRGTIVNRPALKSAEFSKRSARIDFGLGGSLLQLGPAAATRLREILGR